MGDVTLIVGRNSLLARAFRDHGGVTGCRFVVSVDTFATDSLGIEQVRQRPPAQSRNHVQILGAHVAARGDWAEHHFAQKLRV